MTNTGRLYYRNSLSVWWMGIFLILCFASAKAQPPVEEKMPPPLAQKEFIKLMDEKDKKINEYKETIESLTAQLEHAGSSCKQTQQKNCDSEKAGLNKKLAECEINILICQERKPCTECPKPKVCPDLKPCTECPKPKVCPDPKPCTECPKPKICPDPKPCPTFKKPEECPAQKPCPKHKKIYTKGTGGSRGVEKIPTEPSTNPDPTLMNFFRKKPPNLPR